MKKHLVLPEAIVSPLQAWRQTHFGTTAKTGNAADGADPDFDGVPNLVEYGGNTSPLQPGASLLNVTPGLSQWTFHLTRQPARTGVTMTLQSTTDFANWTPLARSENSAAFTALAPYAAVSETGSGPVQVAITITITLPAPAPAQRFFRLMAEPAAP